MEEEINQPESLDKYQVYGFRMPKFSQTMGEETSPVSGGTNSIEGTRTQGCPNARSP
jgi:hypothetical protein